MDVGRGPDRPHPAANEPPISDFGAVYERYYQDVFRAVRAVVLDPVFAEDITQDAFLKAYRNRHRYQPMGRLRAWLHRIAIREAISAVRRRTLQGWLIGTMGQSELAPPDPWLGHLLADALAVLRPKTRAAVVLYHYHGYRYREIAEILGVPEGTVATRIANGLRQMRKVVKDQPEETERTVR